MDKYNFTPHEVYNTDETALTTAHVPPKVIAQCGAKQVGQVTSADRGTLITAVCCVNAGGVAVPLTLIWPRKTTRNLELYMEGTTPESLGLAHENGWMDGPFHSICYAISIEASALDFR